MRLRRGDVEVHWHGFPEADLPREGPIVLIANHPFGVIDGLVLCDLAMRLRGDFRVLIHALLCRDEDLNRYFLPVDFAATADAGKTNLTTRRRANDALADDIPVLIFPGGRSLNRVFAVWLRARQRTALEHLCRQAHSTAQGDGDSAVFSRPEQPEVSRGIEYL